MATEAQRAPRVACGRTSMAATFAAAERRPMARLRRFWAEIEPGFQIDRDNTIERWDATAEGRATSISYEGFGWTGLLFIGRTPKAVRP